MVVLMVSKNKQGMATKILDTLGLMGMLGGLQKGEPEVDKK